jgi:DNA-directed RNA polymerase subunit RPC12/RpoP
VTQDACCARPGGDADGRLARRDYRCLACGEAFELDDQPQDAHVVCPACGSGRVREHWESRVRNAGRISSERFEELRDRPG